jgi:excisionase family DNA binding protein
MKDKQEIVGKAGWRPDEWAAATGVSRSYAYELLAAKKLDSVKIGTARIIVTSPAAFLAAQRGSGEVA